MAALCLPTHYYSSDEEEEGLFRSDSGPFKTNLVMPKSKGADFGFLISEALSQLPANFPESFDSFCPGLDGKECAEKYGMFFIEAYAKRADNINQLFEGMC